MSGIFGVVSKENCIDDLFFGTDYHSHLGKKTGGMAVFDGKKITFDIKDISMFPFRPQLTKFYSQSEGNKGIGVISDLEPQPVDMQSHLGNFAIAQVGRVNNLTKLVEDAQKRGVHFRDMSGGGPNPTEVIGSLINKGKTFAEGIEIMQNTIQGSSSVILLTPEGIYVGRDKQGRTPIHLGKRGDAFASCTDNSSFKNLGFRNHDSLGPGEIGIITETGYEQLKPAGSQLQECAFLLVYYGNPAATFGGRSAEQVRNNLGKFLAKRDKDLIEKLDFVAGIPDSGIGSGVGYSHESRLPYKRPLIKYTETWQRSFMPQNQADRKLVANMKIIFIEELIRDRRFALTDDSLVRGTQSQQKMNSLFRNYRANEVHFRLSCPPLMFRCEFLNFSISESALDLAAGKAIRKLERPSFTDLERYLDEESAKYEAMTHQIKRTVGCTSLGFQKKEDMIEAIGIEKKKLCTYCWDRCKGDCST